MWQVACSRDVTCHLLHETSMQHDTGYLLHNYVKIAKWQNGQRSNMCVVIVGRSRQAGLDAAHSVVSGIRSKKKSKSTRP